MKLPKFLKFDPRNIKLEKKHFILLTLLTALLLFAGYLIRINLDVRDLEKYTEVTFISPHEALVFWRSEDADLGYARYGNNKFKLDKTSLQTSSEPGEIHVVVIEDIPIEGIYLKKYLEKDNFLIFPPVMHIKYSLDE